MEYKRPINDSIVVIDEKIERIANSELPSELPNLNDLVTQRNKLIDRGKYIQTADKKTNLTLKIFAKYYQLVQKFL